MARYARINDNHIVEIIETGLDPATLYHPEIEFIKITKTPQVGWLYENGKFKKPSVDTESLINQATLTKQALQSAAEREINLLQRAVKLGIATDEETGTLEKWEMYSVLLNRIDANQAPDIDWPTVP